MSETYLSLVVTDDGLGIPGNKNHCAIVNAIYLSDPDIVTATVDKQFIKFGRRSTGERYVFDTPASARQYIAKFDMLASEVAEDGTRPRLRGKLRLEVTDQHLLQVIPRRNIDRVRSIANAARRATDKRPVAKRQPVSRRLAA